MIMAIHQPSLIPWLAYFRKIQLADKFCIMRFCQFEKNGYTNRFKYKDKWMTIPIQNGMESIHDKRYVNGYTVEEINLPLIYGFARMLGINTDKIVLDHETMEQGTDRIIDICRKHECNKYLTNPSAEDKYLDVKAVNEAGIEIIPFNVSNDYNISLFEAFEKWGIEGTRKMVQKPWIL
jgi:hypothetical protein